MAVNFPGPYAIELLYEVSGLEHRMLLNVQVSGTPSAGVDLTTVDLLDKDGGTRPIVTAMDEFIDLLQIGYATGASFVEWTLWSYTPNSFDRTFINTWSVGEAGLSVAPTVLMSYRKISFRTANGGILYITMLEGISDGLDQQSFPFSSGNMNDIANYVTTTGLGGGWIYARDNSYPVAPLRLSEGQNEKLFRIRHR